MLPHREIFWNIRLYWLFYPLSFISIFIFFYGLSRHISLWKKGVKKESIPFVWEGIKRVIIDGILAKRILKGDIAAGVMHLFIFWGFIGLFSGTIVLAIDHYLFHFLVGTSYLGFSFVLEISGLLLISGLILALIRRYIQKIERLETKAEDLVVIIWLIAVVITGFLLEGLRISSQSPKWEEWSFIGFIISAFFSKETALNTYPFFWWIHAILSLSFIASIPFTKLFHMVTSPISIYLKDWSSKIISIEERGGTFFSYKDLIQLDACTRCGRCVEVCPSSGVGEPFKPKDILFMLKEELLCNKVQSLDPKLIWYCTTCGACLEICPIYVPPFEIIRGLRAKEIEDGTRVPPLMTQTLERLYKYNNPWLSTKKRRAEWARDMEILDITKTNDKGLLCYFVGCTTSLDTRAQEIARSFSMILNHCGVRFGILGKKEPCCGDIARRVGEDGLFEEQAEECLRLFNEYGIEKIITSSPHCFHTIKNEYPFLRDTGSKISVKHYSQFLEELIKDGKLEFKKELTLKVTYHDPCYLGRHNKIFDTPRNVINAIPGIELVEMKHNRENSLCCGGGGGRMWQEGLDVETKMSERRIMEAYETGAEVVITCCPLCLIMLEDARKTKGLEDTIKVMDLNELVVMALNND